MIQLVDGASIRKLSVGGFENLFLDKTSSIETMNSQLCLALSSTIVEAKHISRIIFFQSMASFCSMLRRTNEL